MRARRLTTTLVTAVLLAATTAVAVGGPVGAAPVDDKKKQAAQLEADINANAEKIAALNEQTKAAQDQLDAANHTIADAEARIGTAQAETNRLKALVHERAASIYRSASSGGGTALFDVDIRTLSTRQQYAAAASDRDDELMSQLAAAKADLQIVQKDAKDAKDAASAQKAQLDSVKADYEAQQNERQRLLGQVQGELKTLVDQATTARRNTEGSAFDPSKVPPASGRAGIVVEFARQQLGKPYESGGAGPNTWDCSGLTMMAWGAAGVGMSHNSEAQYASFPRVPMDALAPGDIVWAPGHVGIYVGGGAVIHATKPGDVVRYIGVGYFQGAVRPT